MVAAETPVLLLISLTETFLSCTKYAMYALSSALKARENHGQPKNSRAFTTEDFNTMQRTKDIFTD